MPQLDQVSFLSQLTWLCIFYFSFYIILVVDFLPKIATLFKIRQKKLALSIAPNLSKNNPTLTVFENYDQILLNSIHQSKNSLESVHSEASSWVTNFSTKINQNQFKKLNISYLQTLAKSQINNKFSFNQLSQLAPLAPILPKPSK